MFHEFMFHEFRKGDRHWSVTISRLAVRLSGQRRREAKVRAKVRVGAPSG